MRALDLVASWPVDTAAAAIVLADGSVHDGEGPTDHEFRLASLTKVFAGWAAMIAVEEGTIGLDRPVGQPGCTLEHLLSHAGGYPFEGTSPIRKPAERRIYSNTGIELAAEAIGEATGITFEDYFADAVLEPLGLHASELRGPVSHGLWSTVDDVATFLAELARPTLLSADGAATVTRPHYPELGGIVPGVGRFDECPWGLGVEIRGRKSPHWTGRHNSEATFGHFGGSGTMMWVDPSAGAEGVGRSSDRQGADRRWGPGAQPPQNAGAAVVALTDRPYDEWAADAVAAWSELSDAVVNEVSEIATAGAPGQ